MNYSSLKRNVLTKRHVWTNVVWQNVSSIASQCISSVDDASGKISSASIRTSLKLILRKESIQKWTVLDDNDCEICVVNGQLEKVQLREKDDADYLDNPIYTWPACGVTGIPVHAINPQS
ncbi:hypothetical protein DPMN_132134 [Dreissena polymorpha]|uniref:Uncharacterized protein n=1 Tax=Dreissena polymorpha TaxID=45954 RepID=A0A9D4FUH4_DREPO|nr:hypothetical protein DPMN_132134 [Dreissena polymorpha]